MCQHLEKEVAFITILFWKKCNLPIYYLDDLNCQKKIYIQPNISEEVHTYMYSYFLALVLSQESSFKVAWCRSLESKYLLYKY